MSTVLRVVLDEPPAAGMSGPGRAAIELARALVATAPADCVVEIVSPAITEEERDALESALPGVGELLVSRLPRRELVAAWQRGIAFAPGSGILHSPTAVAPLRRHDRAVDPLSQVSVTFDALPDESAGGALDPRGPRVVAAFLRRAERYADAVVVPTHAVADRLRDDFGERVRVIPPGVAAGLAEPDDAAERRRRLGLPPSYVLLAARPVDLERVADLVARADRAGVDVAVIDAAADDSGEDPPDAAGSPDPEVLRLPVLDDADRAAAVAGASIVVDPARTAGSSAVLLEAMALGVPTVIGPAPGLAELAAGASVALGETDDPVEAVVALRDDSAARERLVTLGRDRARVFTWTDAAEKVWQLHADL